MAKPVVLTYNGGVIKDTPAILLGSSVSQYTGATLSQGTCQDARHVRFEDNVAKKMQGYSVYFSTADANKVNGLWCFKGSDSNIYTMVGTKTTMNTLVSGIETALASAYTGLDTETATQDANPWSFANFGSILLFTNGVDVPQMIASPYTAVAVIPGSPPIGDVVRVFQRHAFILGQATNCNDVTWSDLDDYTDWTPAPANEAGSYTFYDTKTRVVGGDTLGTLMMVYSEDSTFTMQYVGSPLIFATNCIDHHAGLWKKQLLTGTLDKQFFMGKDNFYMTNGVTVSPIGDGIKYYVWSVLNTAQMSCAFAFTISQRKEVWFCIPTTTSIPYLACVYNWGTGLWTLDTISWTAGIDRIPISYPLFANSDNKIYALEYTEDAAGAAYAAYVDSAEQGSDEPNAIKQILNIYPFILSSASLLKIYVGFRDNINESITWSSAYSYDPQTDYKIDTRNAGSGRLWSVRVVSDALASPFSIAKLICIVESAGGR